jgi:iron complex transport system substrate-binding protein
MTVPGKNIRFTGRKSFLLPSFSLTSLSIRWLCCLLLTSVSCQSPQSAKSEKATDFDPGKDYFPDKVEIHHARGFSVRYFGHYKVLSVADPFETRPDTTHYVLVQRGTPKPSGYAKAQFIEIPIRTLIGGSSSHIALTDFLNANDVLVGLGSFDYINSPQVLRMMDEKKLAEVGSGGSLNQERVLSMAPDLLMIVGRSDGKYNTNQLLVESGIGVITNSEWMENTPLGRAEWVKLMAVLLNKEALVNEKFGEVERRYTELAQIGANVKLRPTVFNGMSFKGVWHVAGGKGYMAYFLKDAGTRYYWANEPSTASLQLNFESVYEKAMQADFWINPSSAKTRQDILTNDSRNGDFKAFKTGQVYNNNRRVNDRGSNDYWESGLVNPHLVLADLIKIFHPELLPEHQLYYYQQIQP